MPRRGALGDLPDADEHGEAAEAAEKGWRAPCMRARRMHAVAKPVPVKAAVKMGLTQGKL